jgi:hypothetical protein
LYGNQPVSDVKQLSVDEALALSSAIKEKNTPRKRGK